jgi:hypothetical protein
MPTIARPKANRGKTFVCQILEEKYCILGIHVCFFDRIINGCI